MYSLLRFHSLSPGGKAKNAAQVGENRPNLALTPPWVQRSAPPQVEPPVPVPLATTSGKVKTPTHPIPEVGLAPGNALNEKGFVATEAAAPREFAAPELPQIPSLTLSLAPAKTAEKTPAVPVTQSEAVSNTQQTAAAVQSVPAGANRAAPAPLAATTFKAIGYVQKANGELEAIISQENEIQVVHLGDEIAGRYRVTKITPEMVGAIDETMLQIPIAKPGGEVKPEVLSAQSSKDVRVATAVPQPPNPSAVAVSTQVVALSSPAPAQVRATSQVGRQGFSASLDSHKTIVNSLGYVQESNGKVEAVMADGDSVRLVPEGQSETMAQNALPAGHSLAQVGQGSAVDVEEKPSGFTTTDLKPLIVAVSESPVAADETVIRQDSNPEYIRTAGISSHPTLPIISDLGGDVLSQGSSKLPSGRVLFDEQAQRDQNVPFEMPSIGFVEKADGQLAAILSAGDGVDVVWQGDKFAGHLRAVTVSRDHISATELANQHQDPVPYSTRPTISDIILESSRKTETPVSRQESANTLPMKKHPNTKSARVRHGQYASAPAAATFIFQTLGYVELQDGEVQAIVADGNGTYVVKPGEVFAGQYQATSIDSTLVVAVRVPPSKPVPDFLAPQTDSRDKAASNILSGLLQSPFGSGTGILPWSGSSQDGLARMGRALGTSPFRALSSGLRARSNFHTTDNPKPGY